MTRTTPRGVCPDAGWIRVPGGGGSWARRWVIGTSEIETQQDAACDEPRDHDRNNDSESLRPLSECGYSPRLPTDAGAGISTRSHTSLVFCASLSIQSGRGTWPVDSAATCRRARCERHGDGRSTVKTPTSRAALTAWLVQAEEVLRRSEEPDTDQEVALGEHIVEVFAADILAKGSTWVMRLP
jgi:hypothetical protein